ncbi:MAG: hypothetical protein MK108_11915 [Mariniblastus sp.]|nr:hypothetical protein [Mariniblastus sp.]
MNPNRKTHGHALADFLVIVGIGLSLLGILHFGAMVSLIQIENFISLVMVVSSSLPTLVGGILVIGIGKILINQSKLLNRVDAEPVTPEDS